MTKLYFVFNFELTTIFAGYAMFSSMIWINTLVILPKQRVDVKDRESRTESCSFAEPNRFPKDRLPYGELVSRLPFVYPWQRAFLKTKKNQNNTPKMRKFSRRLKAKFS